MHGGETIWTGWEKLKEGNRVVEWHPDEEGPKRFGRHGTVSLRDGNDVMVDWDNGPRRMVTNPASTLRLEKGPFEPGRGRGSRGGGGPRATRERTHDYRKFAAAEVRVGDEIFYPEPGRAIKSGDWTRSGKGARGDWRLVQAVKFSRGGEKIKVEGKALFPIHQGQMMRVKRPVAAKQLREHNTHYAWELQDLLKEHKGMKIRDGNVWRDVVKAHKIAERSKPGGWMLVRYGNEEAMKMFVRQADRVKLLYARGGIAPGSGYGDTVPAMLTPGEVVFSSREQRKLMNKLGVSGGPNELFNHVKRMPQKFQSGGVSDGWMSSVTSPVAKLPKDTSLSRIIDPLTESANAIAVSGKGTTNMTAKTVYVNVTGTASMNVTVNPEIKVFIDGVEQKNLKVKTSTKMRRGGIKPAG
jgi:hypothetical protein